MLRRAAQDRLVQIHDFLRFVIEKIDLGADHSHAVEQRKEILSLLGRSKVTTVLPKPELDVLLIRVINQLTHLRFGPALPNSFDDVVLKAKLTGESRKLFNPFESIFAAIQVTPNGAARFYPGSFEALRKNCFVRRR